MMDDYQYEDLIGGLHIMADGLRRYAAVTDACRESMTILREQFIAVVIVLKLRRQMKAKLRGKNWRNVR